MREYLDRRWKGLCSDWQQYDFTRRQRGEYHAFFESVVQPQLMPICQCSCGFCGEFLSENVISANPPPSSGQEFSDIVTLSPTFVFQAAIGVASTGSGFDGILGWV